MRSSIRPNETGRPWHCLTGQHLWRHKLTQGEMAWFNYTARERALLHTQAHHTDAENAYGAYTLHAGITHTFTHEKATCLSTHSTHHSIKCCPLVLPTPRNESSIRKQAFSKVMSVVRNYYGRWCVLIWALRNCSDIHWIWAFCLFRKNVLALWPS